jgi:hypothetical protein
MPNQRSSQILAAKRKRQFVRFHTRFEAASVRGYVLDVGLKFFALATVCDRIWFDGFECFRIGDIRGLRPDPYTEFTERALKKRGERMPNKPAISISNIQELLLSAGSLFPLVTIHQEGVDPDVCWIGRVVGVDRDYLSLLEITPAAKWEAKATSFELKKITRVSFGADYEAALCLVGGEPKEQTQSPKSKRGRRQ